MEKMNSFVRVEKHIIKQTDKHFSMLMDFGYMSKNLYNHANYLVRKEFTDNDKWLRYGELDKIRPVDGKWERMNERG